MRLEDDIDISRGDIICRPHNQPDVSERLRGDGLLDDRCAARPGGRYAIKHSTRTVRAVIDDLRYRMDVNTLHRDQAATELGLNEIGRVRIRTSKPLLLDEYRMSRATGGFIVIDEVDPGHRRRRHGRAHVTGARAASSRTSRWRSAPRPQPEVTDRRRRGRGLRSARRRAGSRGEALSTGPAVSSDP